MPPRAAPASTSPRVARAEVTVLVCLSMLLPFASCGTMSGGRRWGQDATLTPGWERVGRAAWKAAASPETWVPAAGALALQVGDADEDVAEWAAKNTPIFGSQENADRMSDHLRSASGAIWFVSGVATPSGHDTGELLLNKARGFGVQIGSAVILRHTVGFLKSTTDRTRPNGGGEAFPSLHAASSAHYNTMAAKNIVALECPSRSTQLVRIGLGGLTAVTAWARVEANQHYPSDVLAGMALGRFFGAFFTDAFLGIGDPGAPTVLLTPTRGGAALLLAWGSSTTVSGHPVRPPPR